MKGLMKLRRNCSKSYKRESRKRAQTSLSTSDEENGQTRYLTMELVGATREFHSSSGYLHLHNSEFYEGKPGIL